MGTKRALLIGINAYPNLERQFPGSRPLSGCLRDVDTMTGLLGKRGFTDIRRVMDGGEVTPTRLHIVSAMDALYDDVARSAAESTTDADVVVFFFAGHGSQVRSRGVPGSPLQEHLFQTLVTSDSGRTLPNSQGPSLPNRDLFDFEIDAWVRRLRRLTPAPAVTLIFDCCHSAGLASDQRGRPQHLATSSETETPTERSAPEDARDWDDLELEESARQTWKELGQSSLGTTRGASGWRGQTLQEAVVLAACRNEETSMGNAQGGFLTHALSKALERYPEASTWKDVFDPLPPEALARLTSSPAVHEHFAPIYSKVQGRNRRQHPVRHGNGPIFDLGAYDYTDGYPESARTAPLKTFAVVIGIADYGGPWGNLQNARRDAEAVAEVLEDHQGYEVLRTSSGAKALCDHEATFLGIFRHLNRLRRAVRAYRRSAEGRHRGTASVIYFAGHGTSVPDADQRRVHGYLIPHGGHLDASRTWLSMSLLRQFLTGPPADDPRPKRRLRSRHLLLVLDCCFAGAIRFAPLRRRASLNRPIFASEYRRFVEGEAWQVLTSSSYHQSALDVVRDPRNPRDPGSRHSPFAQALIEALSTDLADASDDEGRRDRILTAGEIHQFVDQRLKVFDFQQPGLAPLSPGNRGQFFFRVPGWQTVATPDPPLDGANNPWPGAAVYDARSDPGSSHPFHGRQAPLLELLAALLRDEPGPRVLMGASGVGKTSLVLGGLWPLLQDLKAHRHTIRRWVAGLSHSQLLLSPSDLAGVRRWMHGLELPKLFHDADALRRRVVTWSRQQGNLPTGGDLSPMDMSGTLPSSLFDLIATERHVHHPWWDAARLDDLLARPEDLCFHLRFWHQEPGLADLLLVEPEMDISAAAEHWTPWLQPWHMVYLRGEDLLETDARGNSETSAWHLQTADPEIDPSERGAWHPRRLESHLQDAPADVPRLLILDDADHLLSSPDFLRRGLPALEKLEQPTLDDGSTLRPWRLLWILGPRWFSQTDGDGTPLAGARLLETLSDFHSTTAAFDHEPSAWRRTVHLLPPSRREIRDVIEQPLLDRALLMPSHVVDRIAEAAQGAASPLTLLGPCLHAMYQQAVTPRKAEDRNLTLEHYDAVGSLTGPWRRRAWSTIESSGRDDRQSMFRLLRRLDWRSDQPLDPRAVLGPGTSSLPPWLLQLLKSRAVAWEADGFRLGHDDLLRDWTTFESWRRASPAAPWEDTLAELAPRALDWFFGPSPQHRRASNLWDDHAKIFHLLAIQDELNVAERAYLEASLERCRARLSRRLSGEALRAPGRRWNQSLLLAAHSLDLARADGLRRSEALARESLRRLLAMSPLSLNVDLPGLARKLTWRDDRQLHVLTSAQPTGKTSRTAQGIAAEDPWHDDWAWLLDLGSARALPELTAVPPPVGVTAGPAPFQVAEEVTVEAADAAERRLARRIPWTQRISLEQNGDSTSLTLRGLDKGFRYLAWSPSGAWLAAICQPEDADAAAPSYGPAPVMEDAVAKLRLWRCVASGPGVQGSAAQSAQKIPMLDAVSEPRSATLPPSSRGFSHLFFGAQGTVLIALEPGQAPCCIDLSPPIPTAAAPSRWLGSSQNRLHGWHGRQYPTSEEPSEASTDIKTWLLAVERSRGKSHILIWDLQVPGTLRKTPVEGVRSIHTVSRRGRLLVDQRGREMRLLDAADGRQLASFRSVDLMEISPDERWAALIGDGTLRIVPLENPQQPTAKLPLPARSSFEELEIAPKGRWCALRAREGNKPGHEGPEGLSDAATSEDANVWLWSVPWPPSSPDALSQVPSQPNLAVQGCRAAFDSAGTQWVVAHASALRWFQLDDDGSCKLLGQYSLASYPTALAFQPGGEYVAVGGLDGSVVMLSRPEPEQVDLEQDVETLRRSDDNPQGQSVHALVFDDGGDRLAVALAAPKSGRQRDPFGATPKAPPQAEPNTLLAIYDLSSDRLVDLARACAGQVLDVATWQRHLAPEPYRPGNLEAANDLMRERLGTLPAKSPKS